MLFQYYSLGRDIGIMKTKEHRLKTTDYKRNFRFSRPTLGSGLIYFRFLYERILVVLNKATVTESSEKYCEVIKTL